MTELEARVALNMVPQLGSIRLKRLFDYFRSGQAVLKAAPEELARVEGIPRDISSNLTSLVRRLDLKKEFELIAKEDINIVCFDSPAYPQLLKEIFDPPILLYVKGEIPLRSSLLAVVGSRRASFYGLKMAEKFSFELASCGVTIVSGLARGIDSAAHKGTLQAGGKTVAVLGSGLSCIYPAENKQLSQDIARHGAVISEFPMSTQPLAFNFPRRNRIISGLSLGVLVIEAAKRSGALITVGCALEQGREVFAIPGKADSPTSWGTNQLIKDGAKLVDEAGEILSEFNLSANSPDTEIGRRESEPGQVLSPEEKTILSVIQEEPISIEQIASYTKLGLPQLLATLTRLEIRGIIKQLPGKSFVLNSLLTRKVK
jgi:DNA processing protein